LRSYLNEKVAALVKKTEINGRGDPLRWPRDNLYPQKLALAAAARSVEFACGLQATEFRFFLVFGHTSVVI
jgi:hypothetical protein